MKTAPAPSSLPKAAVALKTGRPEAFDAIFEKHRNAVYGLLVRLTRRPAVAEELFQETWLRLVRHAPQFLEEEAVRPWLLRVARNLAVDELRRRRFEPSLEVELPERLATENPEAEVEGARLARRLERALGRLPLRHREVLILMGVEGLDAAEAGQVLSLSSGSVRKRLSRARQALTEVMEEEHSHD